MAVHSRHAFSYLCTLCFPDECAYVACACIRSPLPLCPVCMLSCVGEPLARGPRGGPAGRDSSSLRRDDQAPCGEAARRRLGKAATETSLGGAGKAREHVHGTAGYESE